MLAFTLMLVLATPAEAERAPRSPDAGSVTESGYDLHSGFWINLHHFLYEQALVRGQADGTLPKPRRGTHAQPASLAALSDAERGEWTAALDHYAKSLVTRDLLFGEGMIEIKDALAASEGAASLERAKLEAGLRPALERAAPVYRARWWPEHDRANRAWMAAARPLLARHAAALHKRAAAAFRAAWPAPPIRVDVTCYASWSGAYTTVGPLHVTVSSLAPANAGSAALEILLHEPSHAIVDPREGPIAEAIARAFAARKHPVPRDLWHAVLFFTTGELVRRALAEGGTPGYEPYAYKHGLYTRSPEWGAYRRVLEAHWLPYLDGKIDFETAVGRVAEAVGKERPATGRLGARSEASGAAMAIRLIGRSDRLIGAHTPTNRGEYVGVLGRAEAADICSIPRTEVTQYRGHYPVADDAVVRARLLAFVKDHGWRVDEAVIEEAAKELPA